MAGIITGTGINQIVNPSTPGSGSVVKSPVQLPWSMDTQPNPLALRTFLIKQGYDLPSSGNYMGPLLKSALADWHSGVNNRNAQAWNSKYSDPISKAKTLRTEQNQLSMNLNGKPSKQVQQAVQQAKSSKPAKIVKVGGGNGGNGGGSGMGGLSPQVLSSLLGGSSNSSVQKLAQAMTDAQYTAPMDLLQSQIDQENAAEAQRQTDIGNWFQNIIAQNKTGNANDASGSAALVSQSNDLASNILKSLGADPNAAAQVGKATLTNEGLLQALDQNQQDYGRNMNTALALSGRDAKNADAFQSKQTTQGLLDQLMALTQQKGSSLAANLSAAQDQILKDKAQRINNYATLAMLNPQMQAAKLNNILTGARINEYNSLAAKNAKAVSSSNAVDMSKLQTSVFTQLPMSSTPGQLAPNASYSQVGAVIAATLKGAGIQKGTPLWKSAARSIASGLTDSHGRSVWTALAPYFT